MSSSVERWAPAIVGAVCLAPFLPLLLPDDRVIPDNIYCDYESFQLPVREFAREELLAGRFPLWIPCLGCGMPLHAGQQASLCHPLMTPLVLALGANQGIKTCLFLHVAIGFAGAYRLARDLSISRWGASLAGAIVVWGAFGVLHLMEGHVTIWLAYALVPWFFVALNHLLRRPCARNSAWLALAIACMAVAGHPQVPFYALLFGLCWAAGSVALGEGSACRLRRIGWGAAAVVCAALMSAAQVLPALELSSGGILQSQRGTVEFASRYSLAFVDFARFVLPNALGNPLCGIEPFEDGDFSHERIGYIGILPLLLVGFGLTRASLSRWQWGAVALSLLGVAIGLANNSPLFETLSRYIPGLLLFRCHGRVLSVVTLFLALLAGRGLDAWATEEGKATGIGAWRRGLPACLLFASIAFSAGRVSRYSWGEYFEYAQRRLWLEYGSAGLMLLIGAVLLIALPVRVGRRSCYSLAMVAALLDLADHAVGNIALEPRRQFSCATLRPEVRQRLRLVENPGDFSFGHGSLSASRIVPSVIESRLSSVVTNEGGVLPDGLARLHQTIETKPKIGLAVGACNLGCSSSGDFWHPLPWALPRLRLIGKGDREWVDMPIENLEWKHVVLIRNAMSGTIKIAHEDAQRLALDVSAPEAGTLVAADLFYPGWQCDVDGRPVAIHAAHGIFRAVDLPPGEHHIVFSYRCRSFRVGVCCSAIGLALVVVLAARKASQPPPTPAMPVLESK